MTKNEYLVFQGENFPHTTPIWLINPYVAWLEEHLGTGASSLKRGILGDWYMHIANTDALWDYGTAPDGFFSIMFRHESDLMLFLLAFGTQRGFAQDPSIELERGSQNNEEAHQNR